MDIGSGFAAAVGAFAFFGCIVATQWISARAEAQKRQLAHEARMKALELGKSLPEDDSEAATASAARQIQARADVSRARAAGTIGTLVPLALAGAAVGTTAMILNSTPGSEWPVASLGIIWGVCGLVCIITLVLALIVLTSRGSAGAVGAESVSGRSRYPDNSSSAFTDRPPSL